MALDIKQKLSRGFQKLRDSTDLDERALGIINPIQRKIKPITETFSGPNMRAYGSNILNVNVPTLSKITKSTPYFLDEAKRQIIQTPVVGDRIGGYQAQSEARKRLDEQIERSLGQAGYNRFDISTGNIRPGFKSLNKDQQKYLVNKGFNAIGGISGGLKADELNPLAKTLSSQRASELLDVKPQTNLMSQAQKLRQQAQPLLEQSRLQASGAKEIRELFSSDVIKSVNKIKRVINKGNFVGDVETLRSSKYADDVNRAIEAVREQRPDLIDENAALDFALSIPTKAETVARTPSELVQARELESKAKTVRDLVYNAEATPETISKVMKKNANVVKRNAENEFKQWQRAVAGGGRTTREAIDVIAQNIEKNTRPITSTDVNGLKDISNISKGWNTVYRNFANVYGERFPEIKRNILDPFDASKGKNVDELQAWAEKLDNDIVSGLGIKKGSMESAAIQEFGEGKRDYQSLVNEFGEDGAKKIVSANDWFRQQYDQLLDDVNATRARLYPNNPDKQIPKRKDYYRHFREMQEGFGALVNIFDQPSQIAPGLESISERTKPKSKWLSFAQKRIGDKTDVDAVGGFIDYVKSASYAKNIDPYIERFRSLREDLVQSTSNVDDPSYGKLNNFINYLDKYANDLAGKTNQVDRIVQEYMPGGRRTFSAINWLNNRVKANVILGNLSSAVAQAFNVPQGIASAGPKNSYIGAGRYLKNLMSGDGVINKSNFIKERYRGTSAFERFDEGILNDTKKFAGWVIGVLDDVGTKYIWESHYAKAINEGINNPVKYADDVTRNLVGGRGIGEVPLLQKAKTTQLFAPFQLEVANLWYVLGDMVNKKQFTKIATFAIAMNVMNRGAKAIRGSDVGFDPINAFIDAYGEYAEEEDKKVGIAKAGGRIAGEVLSNVPLGQTAAAAYPEYGFKVGDFQAPTRQEFFGEGDPTRFGGGLLAAKGLADPLFKVAPPFGGQQVKRTLEGLTATAKGYSESKTGRVRYPIAQNARNVVQSGLFGQYSVPEARAYFDEGGKPLGDNDSELFKKSDDKRGLYDKMIGDRQQRSQENKAREVLKTGGQAKAVGSKIMYYNELNGNVESIDIGKVSSMPENSNLAKALKQKEVWKTVNKVAGADISDQEKQEAYQKLGVKPQEADYYSIATQDTDIKMAYLKDVLPRFRDRDALLQTLAMMRGEINGQRILNNNMIDELYKADVIGANEKSMLKNMKYDDGTGKVVNTGKGKKIKVPSLVTTSELLSAFSRYLKAQSAQTPTQKTTLGDLYRKRREQFGIMR